MTHHTLDPFRLFIDPQTKTVLILNPKVMTTFLRVFIKDGLAEFRGLSDPSDGRYKVFVNARNFPLMPLATYWDFARNRQNYDIFAFVRNPYDRTLSAWKNKFHDPHHASADGARAAYPRSIKGRELSKLRRFASRQNLDGKTENTPVPFDTFLRYIQAQAEGTRNRHWDTQSSVIQFNRFDFKAIFRIEDQLEDGFHTIFGRLGFDPDWTTERLKRPLNVSSTPKQNFYTPQATAMVAQVYETDFDSFGYAIKR